MKQIAIFLSLLISTTLYAQKKYGNVVDQTGSPIIGATVLEEGTTNGTTTDANGNFAITLTYDTSTILLSSVGYNSSLKI